MNDFSDRFSRGAIIVVNHRLKAPRRNRQINLRISFYFFFSSALKSLRSGCWNIYTWVFLSLAQNFWWRGKGEENCGGADTTSIRVMRRKINIWDFQFSQPFCHVQILKPTRANKKGAPPKTRSNQSVTNVFRLLKRFLGSCYSGSKSTGSKTFFYTQIVDLSYFSTYFSTVWIIQYDHEVKKL